MPTAAMKRAREEDIETMDMRELSEMSCMITTSKQRVKKQSLLPASPELQWSYGERDVGKSQGRPFSADMKVRVVLCSSLEQIYAITNDKKPHECPTAVLHFDTLNKPELLSTQRRKLSDPSSDRLGRTVVGDSLVYDYRNVTQAIYDHFGIEVFSYVQVVRVSSEQDPGNRHLVRNQKVLKLNVIPRPIDRFHNTKYLKADVCYPRYKAMMTLYIVPYMAPREQRYYTTQLLMDQEERMMGLSEDVDYFGPAALGLPVIPMAQRIKIAEAIRLQQVRDETYSPWYLRDQILQILQEQYWSKRQYNGNETAAISVLVSNITREESRSPPRPLTPPSPPPFKRISIDSLLNI